MQTLLILQKTKTEYSDEDPESEEDQRKKKGNKRRRMDAARFIDAEVEVASDEEDVDLGDKKEQYYDPKELERKANADFSLAKLEAKYQEKA